MRFDIDATHFNRLSTCMSIQEIQETIQRDAHLQQLRGYMQSMGGQQADTKFHKMYNPTGP